MYSEKIKTSIQNCLEKLCKRYTFEEGEFQFWAEIDSILTDIEISIHIDKQKYTVTARFPIRIDTRIRVISEYILRINEYDVSDLKPGFFNFDIDCSTVSYNVLIDYGIDSIPSESVIERSIITPIRMFTKYGSGFFDIIFNDSSGKEAFNEYYMD